jgi:SAM-dependent methyltransferase
MESCAACGSNVRYRALVRTLSLGLFGESIPLPRYPQRPDLAGVGFSDWEPFAERLSTRLAHTNTYLHREPELDLTSPPAELAGTLDYVLCSEVLEHVAPPVERAVQACFDLLKPGGLLVLTVPYMFEAETAEHYPRLADYTIVELGGDTALVNRTRDGIFEVFPSPVFHGGDGETLEMRLFALEPLLDALRSAGFVDVAVAEEEEPGAGVIWLYEWSLPVVARRPAR